MHMASFYLQATMTMWIAGWGGKVFMGMGVKLWKQCGMGTIYFNV